MVESRSCPLVSVILPVYNCEKYVGEAIDSILRQSFLDFELIITNDGSTDGSLRVIESFKDPRIRVVVQKNMGLSWSLNNMISLARGKYIARQDADDISEPTRLSRQVEFLENNRNFHLVGAWAKVMVDEQMTDRTLCHPESNKAIRLMMYLDTPFVHTSVMMRTCCVREIGGYALEKNRQPEDYELWLRMSRRYRFANLAEYLVVYREIQSSITRIDRDPFPFAAILSQENFRRSTFFLLPESISMAFFNIYRGRKSYEDTYRRVVVLICAVFIMVRERACTRDFLRRIKRMYI